MVYIVILIIAVFFLIFSVKILRSPLKTEFKPIFVNGNKNHNEITKIQKRQCTLKFEDGKFFIIQGENKVEDISADIYHIRVWKFKDALYMAIRMKTHSEYKFLLVENIEKNEVEFVVMYNLAKQIAKGLKIEFKDCGESETKE